LLILITLFIVRKKVEFLFAGLCLIVISISFSAINRINLLKSKEMIIYHNPGNSVIQFRNGNRSVWIVNKKDGQVDLFIERAIYAMKSKQNVIVLWDSIQLKSKANGNYMMEDLWCHGSFILFNTKRIFLTNEINSHNTHIKTDYLIVNNLKTYPSQDILFSYPAGLVIIEPSTTTESKAKTLARLLAKENIKTYFVEDQGALRIEADE